MISNITVTNRRLNSGLRSYLSVRAFQYAPSQWKKVFRGGLGCLLLLQLIIGWFGPRPQSLADDPFSRLFSAMGNALEEVGDELVDFQARPKLDGAEIIVPFDPSNEFGTYVTHVMERELAFLQKTCQPNEQTTSELYRHGRIGISRISGMFQFGALSGDMDSLPRADRLVLDWLTPMVKSRLDEKQISHWQREQKARKERALSAQSSVILLLLNQRLLLRQDQLDELRPLVRRSMLRSSNDLLEHFLLGVPVQPHQPDGMQALLNPEQRRAAKMLPQNGTYELQYAFPVGLAWNHLLSQMDVHSSDRMNRVTEQLRKEIQSGTFKESFSVHPPSLNLQGVNFSNVPITLDPGEAMRAMVKGQAVLEGQVEVMMDAPVVMAEVMEAEPEEVVGALGPDAPIDPDAVQEEFADQEEPANGPPEEAMAEELVEMEVEELIEDEDAQEAIGVAAIMDPFENARDWDPDNCDSMIVSHASNLSEASKLIRQALEVRIAFFRDVLKCDAETLARLRLAGETDVSRFFADYARFKRKYPAGRIPMDELNERYTEVWEFNRRQSAGLHDQNSVMGKASRSLVSSLGPGVKSLFDERSEALQELRLHALIELISHTVPLTAQQNENLLRELKKRLAPQPKFGSNSFKKVLLQFVELDPSTLVDSLNEHDIKILTEFSDALNQFASSAQFDGL